MEYFYITCLPNIMKIEVSSLVISTYGAMTLRDRSCTGQRLPSGAKFGWPYSIRTNLAGCGNIVHVSLLIYSFLCFFKYKFLNARRMFLFVF